MSLIGLNIDTSFVLTNRAIVLRGFGFYCIYPHVILYSLTPSLFSTTGHQVYPFADNMYTATKYAVTALTEGLRQELRAIKSKIRITVRHLKVLKGF